MRVTLQYFDGCPNWKEAEAHIEQLRAEGFDLEFDRHLIETTEEAIRHGFRGSPTIIVEGIDPLADPELPIGLSCRMYLTESGYAGSPSLDQLRTALRGAG